jgi:hypothetical protein
VVLTPLQHLLLLTYGVLLLLLLQAHIAKATGAQVVLTPLQHLLVLTYMLCCCCCRRIAKATGAQVVLTPLQHLLVLTYVVLLLLQAHCQGHWRAGGADAG